MEKNNVYRSLILFVVMIAAFYPMMSQGTETAAGTCLQFTMGDSSFLQTEEADAPIWEVTVMAWVLMEDNNADVDQGIVFHPSSFLFELEGSKNFSIDFTITPYSSSELSPDDETWFGEWTHYAGTYDGAQITVYKDGEWLAEMDANVEMGQDPGSYEIGRSIWGSAERYFYGLIDEVNKCLSKKL